MSRNMYCAIPALGTLVLLCNAGTASAQWLTNWYDPCRSVRPVAQAAYRTVPVTEYRQVRQIVQKPVYETKYVNRQVTEMHPVTEQRTAEIPTVDYVSVTENRTVTRDMGQWNTYYQQNPRVSPCQYDPRPGMLGWLNRSGYRVRSAFTPRVSRRRQYTPNLVTYNVPTTRQVAQHGTRKVTYNVTRMVPRTTTRKVAINTVRYVSQEIVQTQPVTVMRTVPIGSSVAYAVAPFGTAPQTALLQPQPDTIGGAGSPGRTANRNNDEFDNDTQLNQFNRDSRNLQYKNEDDETKRISLPVYQRDSGSNHPSPVPQAQRNRTVPSAIRVGQWKSARRIQTARPVIDGPTLVVADSAH